MFYHITDFFLDIEIRVNHLEIRVEIISELENFRT